LSHVPAWSRWDYPAGNVRKRSLRTRDRGRKSPVPPGREEGQGDPHTVKAQGHKTILMFV
jgi:hypothetical protein